MISIEINLLSIYFQFIWIYFQLIFLLNQKKQKTPKKMLCTIGTIQTITLLRISVTHVVPPWKIVWVLFLIRV